MHAWMVRFVNDCQRWRELEFHRQTSGVAFRCCAGGIGDIWGICVYPGWLPWKKSASFLGLICQRLLQYLLVKTVGMEETLGHPGHWICWPGVGREGRVGHGFLLPYLFLPLVVQGSIWWGIELTIVFGLTPLICQGSPGLDHTRANDGIVASSFPPAAVLFIGPMVTKYFDCRYSVFKFGVRLHIQSVR